MPIEAGRLVIPPFGRSTVIGTDVWVPLGVVDELAVTSSFEGSVVHESQGSFVLTLTSFQESFRTVAVATKNQG